MAAMPDANATAASACSSSARASSKRATVGFQSGDDHAAVGGRTAPGGHGLVRVAPALDIGQRVGGGQVDRQRVDAEPLQVGAAAVDGDRVGMQRCGHASTLPETSRIRRNSTASAETEASFDILCNMRRVGRRAALAKAQLDETDLELLAALTRDAEITNKALAHRLGLAESTCAHRVRALRERGIIRDTRVRVDGAALGYPLQAIIKVRLANHTGPKVTALFDALVAVPRVLQVSTSRASTTSWCTSRWRMRRRCATSCWNTSRSTRSCAAPRPSSCSSSATAPACSPR